MNTETHEKPFKLERQKLVHKVLINPVKTNNTTTLPPPQKNTQNYWIWNKNTIKPWTLEMKWAKIDPRNVPKFIISEIPPSIIKPLANWTSMYSAEFTAIDLSLNLITTGKHNKIITFTDSMSGVNALKTSKGPILTSKISNSIQHILKENKNLTKCWMPRHICIGNDQAYSEAKRVLSLLQSNSKLPYTNTLNPE